MQFKFAALLAAALAAPAALASPTRRTETLKVTFDQTYDNAGQSLATVACSNGANGLLTKGFTTFGSLPDPYIGGSQFVSGWNSTECGSCWTLSYNGKSLNLIAIDTAGVGFNIAKGAFDYLADAHAEQIGSFEATVESADPKACGFKY